jgi:hypothetical protein
VIEQIVFSSSRSLFDSGEHTLPLVLHPVSTSTKIAQGRIASHQVSFLIEFSERRLAIKARTSRKSEVSLECFIMSTHSQLERIEIKLRRSRVYNARVPYELRSSQDSDEKYHVSRLRCCEWHFFRFARTRLSFFGKVVDI